MGDFDKIAVRTLGYFACTLVVMTTSCVIYQSSLIGTADNPLAVSCALAHSDRSCVLADRQR